MCTVLLTQLREQKPETLHKPMTIEAFQKSQETAKT